MKKIKPKYPIEYPVKHSRYGLHSCTSGKGIGKKSTYICTADSCNYTARVPRWPEANNMSYNASLKCPTHNTELKEIGDVIRLPKAGSKKRAQFKRKLIN